ncbi:MAG: ABC transporter permease subunit [Actinomycetota bacterium]
MSADPTLNRRYNLLIDVLRPFGGMVIALGALVAVWVAFLEVFDVSPFVGISPARVWDHLFVEADAAENRAAITAGLGRTLLDAGLGLLIGGAASIGIACIFVLYRPIERSLLPIGIALQTVPIVALVPLLALIFGRGLVSTVIVVGIIVFFPTLVLVTHGLRSISAEAVDLMRSYDASPRQLLVKVRLPSAVPSMFAASKIAVPGAILGALLAEWLVTGVGLGYEMLTATTTSDYKQLWAATITLTSVAIIVYTLSTVLERIMLERFAPDHVRV